jgi:hypothetical protein
MKVGDLYKYIHKLKANNAAFVDFSPTAVNYCFTEGHYNYSAGFTLHNLNSGSVNISFVVTGMQSDQHSGARVHWRRVLCAEYVRKKLCN